MQSITQRPLLPTQELRDEGYLQEANRQFFHPLGLALAVGTNRPSEMADRLDEALTSLAEIVAGDDEALDKLRRVRDVLRTSDATVSVNVLDGRDDPEGVIFTEEADDLTKALRVEYLWREAEQKRRPALGFMVQPIAGLKTAADRLLDSLNEIRPLDLAEDEKPDVAASLAEDLGL